MPGDDDNARASPPPTLADITSMFEQVMRRIDDMSMGGDFPLPPPRDDQSRGYQHCLGVPHFSKLEFPTYDGLEDPLHWLRRSSSAVSTPSCRTASGSIISWELPRRCAPIVSLSWHAFQSRVACRTTRSVSTSWCATRLVSCLSKRQSYSLVAFRSTSRWTSSTKLGCTSVVWLHPCRRWCLDRRSH